MMKKMLAFCCCCAAAGALAAAAAANDASKPRQSLLVTPMACFGCPNCADSRRPIAVATTPQRDKVVSRYRWKPKLAMQVFKGGLLDRFDQLTGLKGLAQKGNATGLERLLAHGLVIEGGHEDDRKHGSGTLEPPPQFNTRHPAEMDVQEETIDLSYCSTIEEFLRRCKDHGRKALCVQQALGGIERAGIVIHDCHDCPTLQHETPRLPSDRKTKSGAIFDRMRTYDRIDTRLDLSLGAVHWDTALVGPRKAFAKCNRRKLNSLCSNTRSLSRCELQAAPPTCVDYACRLGMPIERRVRGCLFRFFLRLLGTFASSAVGDRQ